jgi:hypothetical protein
VNHPQDIQPTASVQSSLTFSTRFSPRQPYTIFSLGRDLCFFLRSLYFLLYSQWPQPPSSQSSLLNRIDTSPFVPSHPSALIIPLQPINFFFPPHTFFLSWRSFRDSFDFSQTITTTSLILTHSLTHHSTTSDGIIVSSSNEH